MLGHLIPFRFANDESWNGAAHRQRISEKRFRSRRMSEPQGEPAKSAKRASERPPLLASLLSWFR